MQYWLSKKKFAKQHLLLLLCVSILPACSTITYYSQSVSGQINILSKKRSLETVIKDKQSPDDLRQKLLLVEKILDFAQGQLMLPAGGSYEDYVDLERQYVVWNIFATPELSLEPLRWCFLIVGCLSYRGYFNQAQAMKFANELRADGMDVYVGGVSAFSTLGWFNDPVMNTMLNRSDQALAKLLFHELAHQKLYIKNDTDFNEAFADAVSIIGVARWLEQEQSSLRQTIMQEQERDGEFTLLILRYREKLLRLYASAISDEEKRREKSNIIVGLRREYRRLSSSWGGYNGFDNWINTPINNAKLSAIATYQGLVPDFFGIYDAAGQDLDLFYTSIEKLASCDKQARYRLLRSHTTSINCP